MVVKAKQIQHDSRSGVSSFAFSCASIQASFSDERDSHTPRIGHYKGRRMSSLLYLLVRTRHRQKTSDSDRVVFQNIISRERSGVLADFLDDLRAS